jgi:copper chaperone CopZ
MYLIDYLRICFFQTVVLKVAMSCQGCAGAVQRALTKMEGLSKKKKLSFLLCFLQLVQEKFAKAPAVAINCKISTTIAVTMKSSYIVENCTSSTANGVLDCYHLFEG